MKKNILKLLTGGLAVSFLTASLMSPVPVFADDWDDWDDLWEEEVYVVEDGNTYYIIDEESVYIIEDTSQQEEERRRREEEERRRREEDEKNKRVTGIRVSTNSVTVAVGATTQVGVQVVPENANNRGVTLTSNNPGVASVDMYANIKGNSPGNAVVTARTNENGYAADIYVTVTGAAAAPAAAAPAAATGSKRDPAFNASASAQILGALPGGAVNLPSMTPMSFDASVANAMKARPDVTVVTAFPYQGHTYMMTLLPGCNLAARLDASGYADWTALFAVSASDPLIQLVAVN
ncbi:MAG: Ig-like domain-containing protein [Lachnospiraceae bacterium]|nr:Ig-like domain-containing protein [Lachnospiraceae bacterium]